MEIIKESVAFIQNVKTNSLLIYMFCTSCKPEIVVPVFQIKSKQKQLYASDLYKIQKFTKNQTSKFGIDLPCILLIVKNFTCDFIWNENLLYWACCSIVLKHATSWWIWKKSCLFAFSFFLALWRKPPFYRDFSELGQLRFTLVLKLKVAFSVRILSVLTIKVIY